MQILLWLFLCIQLFTLCLSDTCLGLFLVFFVSVSWSWCVVSPHAVFWFIWVLFVTVFEKLVMGIIWDKSESMFFQDKHTCFWTVYLEVPPALECLNPSSSYSVSPSARGCVVPGSPEFEGITLHSPASHGKEDLLLDLCLISFKNF